MPVLHDEIGKYHDTFNRTLRLDQVRNNKGGYFSEIVTKKWIVLHCTASGSVKSAYSTWKAVGNGISTPFVIDRDGTVYELFDFRRWSFHTGLGPHFDRQTIGIELVNYGFLKGQGLTMYDSKIPTEESIRITTNRFGDRWWQSYPDVQVRSAARLVASLCALTGLSHGMEPSPLRLLTDHWPSQPITFHQCLSSNRADPGPAFPYQMFASRICDEIPFFVAGQLPPKRLS